MVITGTTGMVMAKDSIFMSWVFLQTIGFRRLHSNVADRMRRGSNTTTLGATTFTAELNHF